MLDAVGKIAILALLPPALSATRRRMARSPSLSSAPPMAMSGPLSGCSSGESGGMEGDGPSCGAATDTRTRGLSQPRRGQKDQKCPTKLTPAGVVRPSPMIGTTENGDGLG